MSGNTGRALHIDKALTNVAMGYRPGGFIADMIFPEVRVPKQSDIYYEFSRADRLRREDDRRSPGTEANRIRESVSSATYFCPNYALAAPAVIEDKANADPMIVSGIINGRTRLVLDKLMLNWEYRVATQVNSTSNVGSSSAVDSAWNGSGDVLGNINTAIDNLKDANGISDNSNIKVVFGEDAWRSARRDSTVRNLINGTNNGGGYATREQMRNLLEVGKIEVGGAFQNTDAEGLGTETVAKIWGDNVLIYYTPPAPSIEIPSFGYSFRWSAPGIANWQVERHPYDTKRKCEDIEVGYYQDEKITGKSYSFLLVAVNSST